MRSPAERRAAFGNRGLTPTPAAVAAAATAAAAGTLSKGDGGWHPAPLPLAAAHGARVPCAACAAAAVHASGPRRAGPQLMCMHVERLRRRLVCVGTRLAAHGGGGGAGARRGARRGCLVGCLVGGGVGLGPVLVAVGEEVRRTAPHALAQPHIDLAPPTPAPSRPTPPRLASAGARGRLERLEELEHMAEQLQVRHRAVHTRHVPLEAQRVVPAQRAARQAAHQAAVRQAAPRRAARLPLRRKAVEHECQPGLQLVWRGMCSWCGEACAVRLEHTLGLCKACT